MNKIEVMLLMEKIVDFFNKKSFFRDAHLNEIIKLFQESQSSLEVGSSHGQRRRGGDNEKKKHPKFKNRNQP